MTKRNRRRGKEPVDSVAKPTGVLVELSSGFEVFITPLPPYHLDVIYDEFPLDEYPEREVHLLSGDVMPWPYEPPDEMPDEDNGTEYELYIRWKIADENNKAIEARRARARTEFLFSNCVHVKKGPFDVEDTEWMDRVEAAFPNLKVPEHYGKAMLLFIKTQVVTSFQDAELVLQMATSPEATLQGISSALRGFQSPMEEARHIGDTALNGGRKS